MGRIPTIGDLPTKVQPLDDGSVYRGVIREVNKSTDTDKNGRRFFGLVAEVFTPLEWKGRSVSDNYICIPFSGADTEIDKMNEFEQTREMEKGVRMGQLAASCSLKTDTPCNEMSGQEFIGREISFTIKNEEYPEGSENYISKIDRYLV